jgi:dihydrofolate reductase
VSDSKVYFDITMSLDGFIAGPNDGPGNGLGDGGERLHEWVYDLASWRAPHGLSGGETGPDGDLLEESMARMGAVVIGRRMFDAAEGWGEDPPFRVPAFVLTHEERAPLSKGETTFTFVSGDAVEVLAAARAAAGGRDVSIAGGANTIAQFLNAGLVDDIRVHVAPILLGDGIRLFDGVAPSIALRPTRVIESPKVAHLAYRVEQTSR